MAISTDIGGNAGTSNLSSLPHFSPIVWAGLAGGAIGLVVFMSRKGGGADNSASPVNSQTNVMLGSLQEDILNIKGLVGTGNASLSDQIKKLNTDLLAAVTGAKTDILAGQVSNASTIQDLVSQVGSQLQAGQTASTDTLGKLITQLQQVSNSQYATLSSTQKSWFDNLYSTVTQQYQTLTSQNQTIINQNTATQQQVLDLQSQITKQPDKVFDFSGLEGRLLASNVDGGYYTVQNGKLLSVDWWSIGKLWGGTSGRYQFNVPLSQYVQGAFTAPSSTF